MSGLALFRRDRRGATVVEFAIIAPIMLTLTMGMIELGYQAYIRGTLQGTVNEAARNSTLEGATPAEIDAEVQSDVRQLAPDATFVIRRRNYASFADVGTLERFTDKKRGGVFDGIRQDDECYFDENGSGEFDDRGADGQGGADDIVAYTVTATYPRLLPMGGMLGWGNGTAVATSVIRNQPYGAQASRDVECTT